MKDELIAKCLPNFVLGTDDSYVLLRDDGNGQCRRIDDKGVFPERYAKRIAECVRACEGIPSSVLSTPGYSIKAELDNLDEQINMRLRAEQRLSAVLASIDRAKASIHYDDPEYSDILEARKNLEEAIAKAEGR